MLDSLVIFRAGFGPLRNVGAQQENGVLKLASIHVSSSNIHSPSQPGGMLFAEEAGVAIGGDGEVLDGLFVAVEVGIGVAHRSGIVQRDGVIAAAQALVEFDGPQQKGQRLFGLSGGE